MKVGDRVVCINDKWDDCGRVNLMGNPIEKEIYVVGKVSEKVGMTFLSLAETGGWLYLSSHFRKIDFNYGKAVAESIEEMIEQEELVGV